MVRDIPAWQRPAFALRDGWRRLTHGRAGFHQLGSDFADSATRAMCAKSCAAARPCISRASGLPGTHNTGVALVEVTQASGPRLIVNNEEERFSGNKHTTEYPRSIDRRDGRDAARAWDATSAISTPGSPPGIIRRWPARMARTVLEEMPQSLKLLAHHRGCRRFDGRRLDQMTRTPKILGAGSSALPKRVPLICMPHHDNHAWFSFAASPFADDDEPVAIAVLDGTGDLGSISLYVAEHGAMRQLYCNDSMFDSLGAFYSVISSTQGGWTWLSSEGRYMGAAAWGDMNRASNPLLSRG